MDSVDLRKKARERAAPPAAPGAGEADAAALEAALAARLEGPSPARDDRFTTWRPGSGPPPPPVLPPEDAGGSPAPEPEDSAPLAGLAAVPAVAGPARAPERATRAGEEAPPRRGRHAADPLDDFFYREDEEAPEVPVGDLAEEARDPGADAGGREEYLTFLLDAEEYAVAIERVREVLKAPPITEVPRAPAHVLGVVTVRGEVVAVVDPRRRLGLPGAPPAAERGRIVIVDAGEGACGLLVDAVASVVRLRRGAVEPCPQGLGGTGAECLAGIGREGERLFTVLDLGALLRRAPGAGRRDAAGERRRAG